MSEDVKVRDPNVRNAWFVSDDTFGVSVMLPLYRDRQADASRRDDQWYRT